MNKVMLKNITLTPDSKGKKTPTNCPVLSPLTLLLLVEDLLKVIWNTGILKISFDLQLINLYLVVHIV